MSKTENSRGIDREVAGWTAVGLAVVAGLVCLVLFISGSANANRTKDERLREQCLDRPGSTYLIDSGGHPICLSGATAR